MGTFQDALELANKFINGEVKSSPTHGVPLNKESHVIISELREYNRRGILTDNSQPFRYEVLKNLTLLQTPFIEGLCNKETHDLMCKNADIQGYVYATINMQTYDLKRSYPIINIIRLTVGQRKGDIWEGFTNHPIHNESGLAKHCKFILDSWNIALDTQPLYYFIFAEFDLPPKKSSRNKLAGDNSFFTKLILE